MNTRSIAEHFGRLPHCAMHQQLRTPREIILLAGIKPHSPLIFFHRIQRIAKLLIEITEQTMQRRRIAMLQQRLRLLTRCAVLPSVAQCQRFLVSSITSIHR